MKMLAVPSTFVFIIGSASMSFCGRNGNACFLEQLHRLLIHAQDRECRITRPIQRLNE